MRVAILGLVAALAALLVPPAVARQKVAVINSQQAILNSAAGREAAQSLEQKYREPLQRLESRPTDKGSPAYRREVEDLRQQLEKERIAVLSDLGKQLNRSGRVRPAEALRNRRGHLGPQNSCNVVQEGQRHHQTNRG